MTKTLPWLVIIVVGLIFSGCQDHVAVPTSTNGFSANLEPDGKFLIRYKNSHQKPVLLNTYAPDYVVREKDGDKRLLRNEDKHVAPSDEDWMNIEPNGEITISIWAWNGAVLFPTNPGKYVIVRSEGSPMPQTLLKKGLIDAGADFPPELTVE